MLVLAGTPIGNLGDASRRLVEALTGAALLAAEDTRVAHRLLAGLGVEARPRVVVVNEHTERGRVDELVAAAREQDVVLVTDAGMPTVSDPGYALVRAAIDAGVQVTAVPGPSAVLTALALSGLPTDRFVFEGFAPRKAGERARFLGALAAEPRTVVLFESPNRTAALLDAMIEAFGPDRRAVVARELTKLHEEVVRGTVAELAAWAADGVRGEVVVVLAGAEPAPASFDDALAAVRDRVAGGARLKEATAEVAAATGLSRKALYDAALAARS
ncbi:16S rRNA (cytidine(1402)-2'-O)-methyltransferase [Amnibacterium endophyticum]|uniref:Ribosomal RNA small subunit methyltransferase I n=1 Tax=Amnibacterium endophyticum TaxID=2109337 RepID=A0ABW4LJE9_9MICO